jgi:rhodanese-related sulfurtransferase
MRRFVIRLSVLAALCVGFDARASDLMTASDAAQRLNAGNLVLFDVRSPAEWKETGVAKGAQAVSVHGVGGYDGFGAEVVRLTGGDRSKPIALICARGGRSGRAQETLRKLGYTQVFDVIEGMLGRGNQPGWIARGLPTRPCTEC